MSACLSENTLLDLVEGRLDEAARRAAAEHLTACVACQDLAAEIARSLAPSPSEGEAGSPRAPQLTSPAETARESPDATGPASERDAPPLARGAAVGRYLVLDRVGAGAMGVVYAAYDPELGRKVALKLLRPDPARSEASALRERLLREAQALARLSHPNVVAVHDLGTFGDQVFVAMEFIGGGTLGAWLRAARRSQREILDVLREAGRGLAAAHAAGIIHRDFKPENVLVDDAARVKVTDFGLARASLAEVAAEAGAGAPVPAAAHAAESLAGTLTRTGALIGTPAYMAPEQLEGRTADARADVYAFCVTAYEALYGERPFAAGDLGALAAARAGEAVRPAPRGSRVPLRLRRALLRGLRARPEDRFQNMPELLAALDAAGRVVSRRWLFAGLAAALVTAAIAAFARRSEPPCTGAAHAWGTAWDEAEASRARAAFARSGRPGAERVFVAVDRALSDQRTAWEAMHTDACMATRVRGEQSEGLLDRRMECLDGRRREAAALAHLFAEADGDVVDHALSAIGSLRNLDACANAKALAEPVPAPTSPDARRKIDELEAALAQGRALWAAGKYKDGLALSTRAAADARSLGYAPLLAKLLVVRGIHEEENIRYADAEATYHEAARTAQDARDDGTLADAWTRLCGLVGFRRNRFAEAIEWGRYAEAAIQRLGGDDQRELHLLGRLGLTLWAEGADLERARDVSLRARVLAARPGVATALEATYPEVDLGGVLVDMGRPEDAIPVFRSVLEHTAELVPIGHLDFYLATTNLAEVLAMTGQADEALAMYRALLPTCEPTDGYIHQLIAAALRRKGDAAAALLEDRLGQARIGPVFGEDSPSVAPTLFGEGADLLLLGRPAEAVAPLERAFAIHSKGKLAPRAAEAGFALARALWDSGGDRARARTLATEARDAFAAAAARYSSSVYRKSADDASAWLASHPAR